jgi:hypothetical protein
VENATQVQSRRSVAKMKRRKIVIIAVNEQGYRIGSSHHNATISDEVVDKMRDLHEDDGIGYRRLAKMFNLSRSVVAKLCKYERRAQTPQRWKKVVKNESED